MDWLSYAVTGAGSPVVCPGFALTPFRCGRRFAANAVRGPAYAVRSPAYAVRRFWFAGVGKGLRQEAVSDGRKSHALAGDSRVRWRGGTAIGRSRGRGSLCGERIRNCSCGGKLR